MADESHIDQEEIEALLKGTQPPEGVSSDDSADAGAIDQQELQSVLNAAGSPSASHPPAGASRPSPDAGAAGMAPADVEFLLNQAEQALASIDSPAAEQVAGLAPFEFEEFTGAPASTEGATFELIRDVELDLKIELGRTRMQLDEVLRLSKGAVVPLDKLAGDPVDVYVNGRLIARGEVLVLNDNFCVRINELIAGRGGGV